MAHRKIDEVVKNVGNIVAHIIFSNRKGAEFIHGEISSSLSNFVLSFMIETIIRVKRIGTNRVEMIPAFLLPFQ
jgi:hypothetical protein